MDFLKEMEGIVKDFGEISGLMNDIDFNSLTVEEQVVYVANLRNMMRSMKTFNSYCKEIIVKDAIRKNGGKLK